MDPPREAVSSEIVQLSAGRKVKNETNLGRRVLEERRSDTHVHKELWKKKPY